jgi:hypothetical protein
MDPDEFQRPASGGDASQAATQPRSADDRIDLVVN